MIGLNEAYLPPASGAVAIGFAIPATRVTEIVNQLLVDGTAEHPWLGVTTRPLTEALRGALGITAPRGAVVLDVAPNGPAAAAGVRGGDVITDCAGRSVSDLSDLLGAVRSTHPGQQVPVTVVRNGQPVMLTVTMGEAPH